MVEIGDISLDILETIKRIQQELNGISFWRMEGLHVGDPLYFEIKYNAGNGLLREFRSMVNYLTTVEIEEIGDNEGKYLFFAEKDGARKDHISWAKKVCGLFEKSEALILWNRSDGKKHWENCKYLYLLPVWLFQMRKVKSVSFICRFHYVCWMVARYPYFRLAVNKILRMQGLKCLLTHCDMHFCSSLLTQQMNGMGIETVTVLHSNPTNEDAWVYFHNPSRHMILYSELMLENAKKHNPDREYVVLGDPRDIGEQRKELVEFKRNKVLAVLLSYGVDSEENILMLETAKWCAENMGYRLKIKKHPIESERRLLIDFSDVDVEIMASVESTLEEYVAECDAVITGATNAFFECVMLMKPTFLADVGNPYYETISGCKFKTKEALCELLLRCREDELQEQERIKKLREQVVAPGNIENNYREFFRSIQE